MVKLKITKQNTLNYKIFIAALFSILIFIFLKLMFNQKSVIYHNKIKLFSLNTDLNRLNQIVSDNKKYQNSLIKINKSLPGSFEEISYFAGFLENISGKYNLGLNIAIAESAKKEVGNISSLEFTLKITGDFNNLTKFMTYIADMPYLTKVNSLKIDQTDGNLTALINIKLYLKSQ